MKNHFKFSKDMLFHFVYGLSVFLVYLGINALSDAVYLGNEASFFESKVLFIYNPLILITLAGALIFLYKSIRERASYKKLLPNKTIQICLFILCFLISWNPIFNEYNFYFDQWHIYDRALLFLLLLLCWKSPLFILPFIFQLLLLVSQYQFPFGGYPILDKRLAIQILTLSYAISLLELFKNIIPQTKKIEFPTIKIWFFYSVCLFSGFYFHSALHKIEISPNGWEWILENDILNNLSAMHERGWLKNWPVLHSIQVEFFSHFNRFGQILILVLEFLGIVVLLHKRLFFVFACAMIVFHLSVFFLNGTFFLPWIWCGILLIWIAKNTKVFAFGGYAIILSFLIIYFLPEFIFVPKLAWFDSKLDSRFELFENDESGNLQPASLYSLAPYNENFQLGNLLPIVQSRSVGLGFLQVEYPHFKSLQKADSAQVIEYIRVKGYSIYEEEKKAAFHQFMKRYLSNHAKAKLANKYLHLVQLPHYFNADAASLPPLIQNEENALLEFNIYHKKADNQYVIISSEQVFPLSVNTSIE